MNWRFPWILFIWEKWVHVNSCRSCNNVYLRLLHEYARAHLRVSWHLERLCMPVWCPVRRCVCTTFWLGAWDFRYVLATHQRSTRFLFLVASSFSIDSIHLSGYALSVSLLSTGTTVCTRSVFTVLCWRTIESFCSAHGCIILAFYFQQLGSSSSIRWWKTKPVYCECK